MPINNLEFRIILTQNKSHSISGHSWQIGVLRRDDIVNWLHIKVNATIVYSSGSSSGSQQATFPSRSTAINYVKWVVTDH